MADDLKVGGGGASGIDLLKDVLGLNTPRGGASGPSAASFSAAKGGHGARGSRMLSPLVNVEDLDRNVPRGTYIDLLV